MCSTMSQQAKIGGYDGSRLGKSISKMVAEMPDKSSNKITSILKPVQTQTPKVVTTGQKPSASPQASLKPASKVGFSKITVTITEEMALQILNYAGHSSKKAATIDVFYAQHKPTQVENALPVYPLAQLYQQSSVIDK